MFVIRSGEERPGDLGNAVLYDRAHSYGGGRVVESKRFIGFACVRMLLALCARARKLWPVHLLSEAARSYCNWPGMG